MNECRVLIFTTESVCGLSDVQYHVSVPPPCVCVCPCFVAANGLWLCLLVINTILSHLSGLVQRSPPLGSKPFHPTLLGEGGERKRERKERERDREREREGQRERETETERRGREGDTDRATQRWRIKAREVDNV